ncbi:hypothetical protein [Methylobacterium soli]|uniref:DUF91 domain-containing protein n=1 Tax=Methylobacterium soli TaxID=553447 RepID=A0A6L3SYU9_9HYPH|nr:hypothetical protein [Methylobacterium soli]KAB1077419.1 hypothetical protein F6X53_19060 [Methylobacterium soli]GJE44398.1 hypothetical protein AEGHOMDF_3586 [Methylobacterium soli]
MSDGIFIVRDDNSLVEMRSSAFESEDLLQELLATHPSLIAGDAVDPTNPRRWLLIAREQAVPGEEGGAGRWSLDHLFVDQDGVPTLVEVKRASDTRGRREVVAQMLDYAANGVVYWPMEAIRQQFERTCAAGERDADEALREHLGRPDADLEEFWRGVDVNLRAGRIRMVFVADVIYPELKRIVEFLNAQMSPAEVIALEIKHYTGQGLRTLVPRLIGRTAEAERRKGGNTAASTAGPQLKVDEWFARLATERNAAEANTARMIYDWWRAQGCEIEVTRAQKPSFRVKLVHERGHCWPAGVRLDGKVVTALCYVMKAVPFDTIEARREVLENLERTFSQRYGERVADGEPTVPLALLQEAAAREKLFTIWQSLVDRIRAGT